MSASSPGRPRDMVRERTGPRGLEHLESLVSFQRRLSASVRHAIALRGPTRFPPSAPRRRRLLHRRAHWSLGDAPARPEHPCIISTFLQHSGVTCVSRRVGGSRLLQMIVTLDGWSLLTKENCYILK